jgi:hypothetical protein
VLCPRDVVFNSEQEQLEFENYEISQNVRPYGWQIRK